MKLMLANISYVILLVLCSCSNRTYHYLQKSSSMEPTVPSNTVVIVDKHAYARELPARWDLVVFKYPNDSSIMFLSRIVGLPGESIIITNGCLVINDSYMIMPRYLNHVEYITPSEALYGIQEHFTVPADSYFLLGDNSQNARDSRFWGALPAQFIIGKVEGPSINNQ